MNKSISSSISSANDKIENSSKILRINESLAKDLNQNKIENFREMPITSVNKGEVTFKSPSDIHHYIEKRVEIIGTNDEVSIFDKHRITTPNGTYMMKASSIGAPKNSISDFVNTSFEVFDIYEIQHENTSDTISPRLEALTNVISAVPIEINKQNDSNIDYIEIEYVDDLSDIRTTDQGVSRIGNSSEYIYFSFILSYR